MENRTVLVFGFVCLLKRFSKSAQLKVVFVLTTLPSYYCTRVWYYQTNCRLTFRSMFGEFSCLDILTSSTNRGRQYIQKSSNWRKKKRDIPKSWWKGKHRDNNLNSPHVVSSKSDLPFCSLRFLNPFTARDW